MNILTQKNATCLGRRMLHCLAETLLITLCLDTRILYECGIAAAALEALANPYQSIFPNNQNSSLGMGKEPIIANGSDKPANSLNSGRCMLSLWTAHIHGVSLLGPLS